LARIRLENISKVFSGNVEAVKNFSLTIPEKIVVSLLGPSGCGKTTTMRIIAGLETPTVGRVYFDGQDVTDLPARERNVAMVFQFPAIYPNVTVQDNIVFPLKAQSLSKEEIDQRVSEVVRTLDLEGVLNNLPRSLDAGMRQKVAIARAIVRKPNVFLFDEPLTNVDPEMRVELKSVIKRLSKELGQTFIYVTHDQSEALTLADRVGVMKDGLLLQYDEPGRIYDRPANTFVGWFLGNPGMNFIEVELKEAKNKFYLMSEELCYLLPYWAGQAIREKVSSKELILGIRPEHIEISKKKKGEAWIEGMCALVEPLAGRRILYIKLQRKEIRAKVLPSEAVAEGEKVWINLPWQEVRLFSRESQKLIELNSGGE